MSLRLNCGTDDKVTVASPPLSKGMLIEVNGESVLISDKDMRNMIMYYFTNTDLIGTDVRFELIKWVKTLVAAPGYNKGGFRLKGRD